MDARSSVRSGDPLSLAAEQVNWINRRMRGDSGLRAVEAMASQLRYVVVRMPLGSSTDLSSATDDEEKIDLSVGHSVGLPITGSRHSILNQRLSFLDGEDAWNPSNAEQNRVDEEYELAVPSSALQWMDIPGIGMASEQFGVVESIARDEDNHICFARLIVGGVFMCRAIAWAPADRLMGPPPIPAQAAARPFWRPYATMAPVGPASVIATGAWYRLGTNPWPRVYECLVRL